MEQFKIFEYQLSPKEERLLRELDAKKREPLLTPVAHTKRLFDMNARALELQRRHPDARQCRLFHLLMGSTFPTGITYFDFPGDDSVEKFIREYKE